MEKYIMGILTIQLITMNMTCKYYTNFIRGFANNLDK